MTDNLNFRLMDSKPKKAVLFVPFWRMAGHVGNNRVDRFVRWLAADGYELVIVRAGEEDKVRTEPWGQEITVVDRLGLHPETVPGEIRVVSKRKPNKLRRALANWVFNPDPPVVWANAAACHPKVIEAMQGARFILSSSPPDSVHVGAWRLSKRIGVPHIMDMRDGWLDEPLKPLLHTSALRRWREGRLESRIAHHAKALQVTSDVWKELFDGRYPNLAHKVHVLTNGYPAQMPQIQVKLPKGGDEFVLIHAGRFTGSRMSQKPELLMEPLLKNLALSPSKGVIRFYGELSPDEVTRIRAYQQDLAAINWRLEFPGSVSRVEMLEVMQRADALLLLSASHAALPSKLFEYLATGLPIGYVVTPKGAAERILLDIPQACNLSASINFTDAMFSVNDAKKPDCFAESSLRNAFLKLIND